MSSRLEVGRGGGRRAGRTARAGRAARTLLAVLVVTAQPVAPATAAPVCESVRCAALPAVTTEPAAYATPLAALGGRTLAQYLVAQRAGQIQAR